jgi:hypothetical protein
MLIASVNTNKRLGVARASGLFATWLRRREVELVLVQEAWRGRKDQVLVPGMGFVAGDAELAVWVREGRATPQVERPAGWWQTVYVGAFALHSGHLDPYASAARVQQLNTLTADLAADRLNIALGDFNLAPRPLDGRFGNQFSTFTSVRERNAFARLLDSHGLLDSTATADPEFTFSRTSRGVPSSFRCDLALIHASLAPSRVTVCAETRTGPAAFTDHSGLLVNVNLDEHVERRAAKTSSASRVRSPAGPGAPAPRRLGAASFRTAIGRRGPSAPLRRLSRSSEIGSRSRHATTWSAISWTTDAAGALT